MMQVTGNNGSNCKKILSILASRDGLCFWTGDTFVYGDNGALAYITTSPVDRTVKSFSLDNNASDLTIGYAVDTFRETAKALGEDDYSSVVVYLDTPKTILIPSEIFREEKSEGYLNLHNFISGPGEQTDISKDVKGTIAVMVSCGKILNELGCALGEFSLMSPQQYNILRYAGSKKERGTVLNIFAGYGYSYIILSKFSGDGFRILEQQIVPGTTKNEILFHIESILKEITVNVHFEVSGVNAEALSEELKKNFANVECA